MSACEQNLIHFLIGFHVESEVSTCWLFPTFGWRSGSDWSSSFTLSHYFGVELCHYLIQESNYSAEMGFRIWRLGWPM